MRARELSSRSSRESERQTSETALIDISRSADSTLSFNCSADGLPQRASTTHAPGPGTHPHGSRKSESQRPRKRLGKKWAMTSRSTCPYYSGRQFKASWYSLLERLRRIILAGGRSQISDVVGSVRFDWSMVWQRIIRIHELVVVALGLGELRGLCEELPGCALHDGIIRRACPHRSEIQH